VDGEKIILCEKEDNKTLENFIFQYYHAALFVDRLEAIEYCARHQDNPVAIDFLKQTLNDRFGGLRKLTIEKLDFSKDTIRTIFSPLMVQMAATDLHPGVRGMAIQTLGGLKHAGYKELFIKSVRDSSYFVAGTSLEALDGIDSVTALGLAKQLGLEPAKWKLSDVIFNLLIRNGNADYANQVITLYRHFNLDQKIGSILPFIKYLYAVKNNDQVKEAIDQIIYIRNFLPADFFADLIKSINSQLKELAEQKAKEELHVQADYIYARIHKPK
jgi:aminopeptidase N